MAEQYMVGVLGGVIASLLGFVFLYRNSLIRFRGLRKLNRAASMDFPKRNSVNKTGKSEGVGTTDIIIVGAGVAGAALAYSLGKDGRQVRVIERDLNAPNRMAGESLTPGGYLKLIELGLEDCVDEIDAQQLLGYTLYKDGKEARVSFPLEKFQSHVAGRTFHNGRFIQRLRKKVASLHNVSLEQGTVTSLIEENGIVKGVHYKNGSGKLLTTYAPLTIVCDGCFSNLRRSLCYPKVLPELYDSFISAIEKKGNIRIAPNKIMAAAPHLTPGALLIGDALNMRHAITGGGMTVALSDVVILRDLLRPLHDLSDASPISKYLESFYTLRKPMSSTINILANVLQKIFSASSNPAMENLQHTFLGYLRLGGMFSYGASAMLCGLCPSPLSLAFHFFSIAIYGVGRLLLPFPSPRRLWDGAKLLWVASSILLPYIYSEGTRQMFFPLTVPAYYRTPPENKDKKNFMH
ncbi:squalene monooxygenase SE2-like isoform X2 [Gossypium arboreum]|uniref:squalene monooxygenase SE2-like isoform X2 n=1 Tax=Gossypium arboreum TaxID=29729 RepID=UPI0022F15E76|nr:squalene monooxygenase SE2-like isoform X2 [Gossypium arboreum]